MKVALLSDIHGNLSALEAVVADVARRGVDSVVNLGDSLSGPLWPQETAEFLMRQPWIQIAGNHERQLTTIDPEKQGASDRYTYHHVSPEVLAWIASLPKTSLLTDAALLCHGTPAVDVQYLLETVEEAGARRATEDEIAARCSVNSWRVVVCGHSHFPRLVRFGGALFVNPGSVGLQAFEDDHHFVHVIETGSPEARYAILEVVGEDVSANLITLPYDHERCARRARENERLDWEHALMTGRALRGWIPKKKAAPGRSPGDDSSGGHP